MSEWTVRESLGLFWVYGGELYPLVASEGPQAEDPGGFPTVPRPARDVLWALLTYTLEQLEAQDKRDEVDSIVQSRPPVDF